MQLLCSFIYTCVYASLMLNIFSPSSGGLGVCTLVVQICRKKKKFSSSESLRMALKPTRLPKAFGSLYRVDALICDIRD